MALMVESALVVMIRKSILLSSSEGMVELKGGGMNGIVEFGDDDDFKESNLDSNSF